MNARFVTVTVQVAVKPLNVEAVIVAVPLPTAVTLPFATVATEVLSEVHVTVLLSASLGVTVAVSVSEPPSSSEREELLRVMPVGLTTMFSVTVTLQVAV